MLYRLFLRCLNIPYTHVENSGDLAAERIGDHLYIYLECSDGGEDWRNNLDFVSVPYKNMEGNWRAHGGFVRVWRSIEPYLSELIRDERHKRITVVGYSHGAALAVLCHEYIHYHRPDIRDRLFGYGFGCPRVICARQSESIREIWQNFTVVRNINDVVTHLPPRIFGFIHVGNMLEIGEQGKYSGIDAHRPESYINELKLYEAR